MTVYLVGAGPGDPGLCTLRGAELLARAEVVVYDRLVDEGLLSLAPPGARRIDAGKGAGGEGISQEELNELLVALGAQYEVVVRLKGGDPYVFGRGGEEALALSGAGVAYELVPGVSALSAVPGLAGVPLTMRGLSSLVTVVTGQEAPGRKGPGTVDWGRVAAVGGTLVVLMGVAERGEIARRLIAGGRGAETPVLVVESGTTARQHSQRTTLGELGAAPVAAPATIVIGDVAALSFFSAEERPLFSWRVVLTRPAEAQRALAGALVGLGAVPVAFPTISIAGPADDEALARAAGRLGEFEWVVVSSVNGVDALFSLLRDARALAGVRVAAIGPATAAALAAHGVVADLVPGRYLAEALVEEFPPPSAGGRALYVRAAGARDVIDKGLVALGYALESVEAYTTVQPVPEAGSLSALVGADAVVFASASAVSGFLSLAGRELLPPVVCSIGPATSARLEEAGVDVTIEATVHTEEGVLAALSAYAQARRAGGASVRGRGGPVP